MLLCLVSSVHVWHVLFALSISVMTARIHTHTPAAGAAAASGEDVAPSMPRSPSPPEGLAVGAESGRSRAVAAAVVVRGTHKHTNTTHVLVRQRN